MGRIALESVTKAFPGGVRAVDGVDLEINDGEFMVLVGPSGCGKTTLLRSIAGLEDVSEGSITIGQHDVTDLAPRERDIAMVFQNYALYPHMDVRANLAYGLKMRKTPKREIATRVNDVAKMLGLEDLLGRRPAQLSGGQRQRVAMGRAIVREPQAFLMDEPLSNLDAKLRVGMRAELSRLHERLGTTTVYVTHDQVEAMTLGERVAVMREGRLQQVDTPQALYSRPKNLYVAAFIGSPSMNLVEATVDGDEISFAGFGIPLDRTRRPASTRGGAVVLGVRPESFEDVAFAEPGRPQLDVRVEVVEDLGSDVHVIFRIDAPRFDAEDVRAAAEEGDDTTLLADEETSLFTARVDPRTNARVGRTITLAVDPSGFYFFDPETGENVTGRR